MASNAGSSWRGTCHGHSIDHWVHLKVEEDGEQMSFGIRVKFFARYSLVNVQSWRDPMLTVLGSACDSLLCLA